MSNLSADEHPVGLTPDELRLLVDALGDAIIFREGRARALDRAARKSLGRQSEAGLDDQERRRKYQALLRKLTG